jgi:hypothetical protein
MNWKHYTIGAVFAVLWFLMFWYGVVDMQYPSYRWYTTLVVAFVGLGMAYLWRELGRVQAND